MQNPTVLRDAVRAAIAGNPTTAHIEAWRKKVDESNDVYSDYDVDIDAMAYGAHSAASGGGGSGGS